MYGFLLSTDKRATISIDLGRFNYSQVELCRNSKIAAFLFFNILRKKVNRAINIFPLLTIVIEIKKAVWLSNDIIMIIKCVEHLLHSDAFKTVVNFIPLKNIAVSRVHSIVGQLLRSTLIAKEEASRAKLATHDHLRIVFV